MIQKMKIQKNCHRIFYWNGPIAGCIDSGWVPTTGTPSTNSQSNRECDLRLLRQNYWNKAEPIYSELRNLAPPVIINHWVSSSSIICNQYQLRNYSEKEFKESKNDY